MNARLRMRTGVNAVAIWTTDESLLAGAVPSPQNTLGNPLLEIAGEDRKQAGKSRVSRMLAWQIRRNTQDSLAFLRLRRLADGPSAAVNCTARGSVAIVGWSPLTLLG